MEDHFGVNQSWLLLAEFFSGEAIPLQITGTPIREEYVGIPHEAIELGAIFLGAIQYRGAHSNLNVPGKALHLGIIRPPDVEDVSAVVCKVSADRRSRNHVPQSERSNALQR